MNQAGAVRLIVEHKLIFMQKSADNGQAWSPFTNITEQVAKKEWLNDFKFITSGSGIQRRDGTLLPTLVNLSNGLHVFGSNDHGQPFSEANGMLRKDLTEDGLHLNGRGYQVWIHNIKAYVR